MLILDGGNHSCLVFILCSIVNFVGEQDSLPKEGSEQKPSRNEDELGHELRRKPEKVR